MAVSRDDGNELGNKSGDENGNGKPAHRSNGAGRRVVSGRHGNGNGNGNGAEFECAIPGRFDGILRDYSAEDVAALSGSVRVEHTLASMGARRLWELLHTEDYVNALGALTGNQAVQMVKAGLKAIYLSGWQVAADANLTGHMYPDQSL